MSSTFYKSTNQLAVKSVIQNDMLNAQMNLEALAGYVSAKRKALNLSNRDIADRSGGLISHATAANIGNNSQKGIDLSSIFGLANAFNVPVEEVIAAAQGKEFKTSKEKLEKLAFYFSPLTEAAQEHLLEIGATFWQRRNNGGLGHSVLSTDTKQPVRVKPKPTDTRQKKSQPIKEVGNK